MATSSDQQFQDYKRAEKKALEILATMKTVTPKKVDIELALIVALFELHKNSLPGPTIVSIVQGHMQQLLPFYTAKTPPASN